MLSTGKKEWNSFDVWIIVCALSHPQETYFVFVFLILTLIKLQSLVYFSVCDLSEVSKDQFTKECTAKNLPFQKSQNTEIYVLHMPKLVMQVLPEQNNQASTTDSKDLDRQRLLFVTCYLNFYPVSIFDARYLPRE